MNPKDNAQFVPCPFNSPDHPSNVAKAQKPLSWWDKMIKEAPRG